MNLFKFSIQLLANGGNFTSELCSGCGALSKSLLHASPFVFFTAVQSMVDLREGNPLAFRETKVSPSISPQLPDNTLDVFLSLLVPFVGFL